MLTELLLMGLGYGPAYKPDVIGWRMTMNLANHMMTDQTNQNQFIVNTNEDGFRTKISVNKPTGLTRLAILGYSTVFGWGVSDDESLAVQFEQILQKNISPCDNLIEVLIAAQPGYSSVQLK